MTTIIIGLTGLQLNTEGVPTDPTAVHTDVANEFATVTEKVSPVAGDFIFGEDSENNFSKIKIDIDNLPGGGVGGGTNVKIDGSVTLSTADFVSTADIDFVNTGGTVTGLINDKAVTFAKIQDVSANIILGRTTAGTGAVEQLSAATVRTILNVEDGATADQTGPEIKALYEAQVNAFTDALFTKLAGIEAAAKDDQTGPEIKVLYELESDTNAFTDSEKAKLAAIDATHYLDPVADITALTALTEASLTDKARVFVEAETTDYFYDAQAVSGDEQPDDQTGGTGFWKKTVSSGDTAASIKTKYESNPDTNVFNNAAQSKLAGIEAAATADQTGPEIKALYEAQVNAFTDALFTKLAGIATNATANPNALDNLSEDTTPTLGGNLEVGANSLVRSLQAGETLSAGDVCYVNSSGKMVRADASAEATAKGLLAVATTGMVLDDNANFILWGTYTTTGKTAGAVQYLSETVGGFTETAPTTSTAIVRIVGTAISATEIFFNPDNTFVEVS